ncbi:sodium channel protein Nach [Lucilia cuprina]|uniref:sodium channel protein Nach n=1 Tax=Lucilia cuprina TaxID=7375 RepID=UPI001F06066C|nr:sodium channel protein Nach [Lucilia cuprina]
MSKKSLKIREIFDTLIIFRRSLIFQTKEFFQNSTLHGVRYIAETGRPVGEKFMWFCFTSIGAVTALVIIMSLWEKFQTNPTITGLDTDFHNQNVVFPTTVVCPEIAFDHEKAYTVAYKNIANYDETSAGYMVPFLELLPTLSFETLNEASLIASSVEMNNIHEKTLRHWAYMTFIKCEDVLIECKYRDEPIKCCSHFEPVYTEHGFCFAFNSRFRSLEDADQKTGAPHDLYETDKKWALFFVPNSTVKIFIFSNEEYFGQDFNPQIEWSENQVVEVRISKKNTYTTDDARQLSIGQRKCIFHDEIKLKYFPEEYTFSSCMKECRMKKAIKLCKCNPPFYKPIPNVPMCGINDLDCLSLYKNNITNIKDCLQCELSCSKTVFNIEKLIKNIERPEAPGVLVEFLTWPIIRYKREVLFGWVDLLVSFGGIASLFLGFSLLSGVEIIYYFTLRACCMVYKNRQQLYEIEERIKNEPPPPINMTLKLQSYALSRPTVVEEKAPIANDTKNLVTSRFSDNPPEYNELGGRRRKAEKDYTNYTKSLYKTPKVLPSYEDSLNPKWQYGQYLP